MARFVAEEIKLISATPQLLHNDYLHVNTSFLHPSNLYLSDPLIKTDIPSGHPQSGDPLTNTCACMKVVDNSDSNVQICLSTSASLACQLSPK